jgi:Fic family protein
MKLLLRWFNQPAELEGLLRAAVAHLWFVTVHPFEDGNGRIARAVTDLALAQLERTPQRFYSMSSQIRRERTAYYDVLEETQKGSLDITEWLCWFLGCFERAIEASEAEADRVLERAAFWRRHAEAPFNPRQRKVLNLLLGDFEGALTAKKWAAIAKCSVDSAQRDLSDLIARGLLVRNPGGSKNTSYSLVPPRSRSAK